MAIWDDAINWLGGAANTIGGAVNDVFKWGGDQMGLTPRQVLQSTPQYGTALDRAQAPGLSGIQGRESGFADYLMSQAGAMQGRAGPEMDLRQAQQARMNAEQMRGQQSQLADMLMAQARGEGPSMAQLQLRQAGDRNMQQAMALGAANARGGRGAGALYNVGRNQAQIAGQLGMDSALLRQQEMLQARQQAAQQQAQMRGQDLSLFGQDAQIAAQRAQQQLQQRQLNDQMTGAAWGGIGSGLGRQAQNALGQGQLNQGAVQAEMGNTRFYDTLRNKAITDAEANRIDMLKSAGDSIMDFAKNGGFKRPPGIK